MHFRILIARVEVQMETQVIKIVPENLCGLLEEGFRSVERRYWAFVICLASLTNWRHYLTISKHINERLVTN